MAYYVEVFSSYCHQVDQYLDALLNLHRLNWKVEEAMTGNPSRVVIVAPSSFAGSAGGADLTQSLSDLPEVVAKLPKA